MLRVLSEILGYAIDAVDGTIGSVSDVLFDDETWKLRWFVVDTGGWLGGRRVLLHPSCVIDTNDVHRKLRVKLTKALVGSSPEIGKDRPVSRQMEHGLSDHFGWDLLWGRKARGGTADPLTIPAHHSSALRDVPRTDTQQEQDKHLRSTNVVRGYHVDGTDNGIGHLEGFLADDRTWTISYLIINTRNWWPGNHVLVAPVAVINVDWSASKIALNVSQNQVRISPVWQSGEMLLPPEYQKRLHAHYRWPGYGW